MGMLRIYCLFLALPAFAQVGARIVTVLPAPDKSDSGELVLVQPNMTASFKVKIDKSLNILRINDPAPATVFTIDSTLTKRKFQFSLGDVESIADLSYPSGYNLGSTLNSWNKLYLNQSLYMGLNPVSTWTEVIGLSHVDSTINFTGTTGTFSGLVSAGQLDIKQGSTTRASIYSGGPSAGGIIYTYDATGATTINTLNSTGVLTPNLSIYKTSSPAASFNWYMSPLLNVLYLADPAPATVFTIDATSTKRLFQFALGDVVSISDLTYPLGYSLGSGLSPWNNIYLSTSVQMGTVVGGFTNIIYRNPSSGLVAFTGDTIDLTGKVTATQLGINYSTTERVAIYPGGSSGSGIIYTYDTAGTTAINTLNGSGISTTQTFISSDGTHQTEVAQGWVNIYGAGSSYPPLSASTSNASVYTAYFQNSGTGGVAVEIYGKIKSDSMTGSGNASLCIDASGYFFRGSPGC